MILRDVKSRLKKKYLKTFKETFFGDRKHADRFPLH